jgi:hypothetical protein
MLFIRFADFFLSCDGVPVDIGVLDYSTCVAHHTPGVMPSKLHYSTTP